ncbi:hypothetical protein DPX16_2478 [Anabarilius grahami]|uniref:Uncharacterized protein n=1 Tax=Anabarilius grahami TaxID=495550 RepID=A0A3N0Z6P6_ANAGA|nr:hypothetical protein DPX16_2478 [Anabarilius grahami]
MEFIKEESEDVKIEETFRVKHEETEAQTGLVQEVFFLPSKRGLDVVLTSLSDGVGRFVCVSPPRSNQNVANLCPLLRTERGPAINWALECAAHYIGIPIRLCYTCNPRSLKERMETSRPVATAAVPLMGCRVTNFGSAPK